jgi:hypothetical protein
MVLEPLLIIAQAHYEDLVADGERARRAARVARAPRRQTTFLGGPRRKVGAAMIRTGARLAGATRLERAGSQTG